MNILQVENLTKTFGTFNAVDSISFNVKENTVMGFLGPNGAGKTTTMRMLVGLSNKTSGNIKIGGNEVVFGESSKTNNIVGYLPEQPAFYTWMTAYEYLSFINDIFQLNNETKTKRINEVLDIVNLSAAKNKRIATYSNGMKQRLGIAQAIINKPKLLIMDEPVSALDPLGRHEVLNLISKLKSETSILFSTHILSDVDKVCDEVTIINKGKVLQSSSLQKLKDSSSNQMLRVSVEEIDDDFIYELSKQKWVSRFETNASELTIFLQPDTKILKENIPLKFFLLQNKKVSKYIIDEPNIEDLFLDLINNADKV
jgi:ABC-2 type transport system ATP-binding protein